MLVDIGVSEGVLKTTNTLIKKNNIEIQKEISELIIGPPIKDTLEILIQSKDHDKIDLIINDFIYRVYTFFN